jgi:hypothetical protein
MHWNNIEFNEVKTGGWSGVVDIEIGVGEGGVFVGRGTGLYSLPQNQMQARWANDE